MADLPGRTSTALLRRLHDWADAVAWAEFVDRYTPLVQGACRRFRLDDNSTEELCQQIWIDLARRLRTFRYDPTGSFRAWLRRFCRSRTLDLLRERKNGRELAIADMAAAHERCAGDDAPERDADDFDPDRPRLLALAAEVQETVRSQVESDTWQAFWLVAVEDRSVREAAEQLGKSYAATFAAQKRIRTRLRAEGRKRLAMNRVPDSHDTSADAQHPSV
jgi:RNA polymerase sigma-70 factor (ECF subfamily)